MDVDLRGREDCATHDLEPTYRGSRAIVVRGAIATLRIHLNVAAVPRVARCWIHPDRRRTVRLCGTTSVRLQSDEGIAVRVAALTGRDCAGSDCGRVLAKNPPEE